MKKQQTIKTEKVVWAIVGVLLMLNLMSWWYVWSLKDVVDRSGASTVDNILQLSKKQWLLETCYEKNIRPCTEEAVKAQQ
ncbi:MAG TPA: hypothetical protein VLA88_02405 [Candidatus Saccharimonadales bacterium]|nr:hypothetical protein [Candidatus Saccharimonadales bacterium]